MKSQSQIEQRLSKLHSRYLRKHVNKVCSRSHLNCAYNEECAPPAGLPRKPGAYLDKERQFFIPRYQVTTVVFSQENPKPVRLCMYKDDHGTQDLDVCDSDSIAASCPKFKSRVSEDEAVAEFQEMLGDDKYVLANMPDLAALQWVLDTRVRFWSFTIWDYVIIWWHKLVRRRVKALPSAPLEPLPENIWNDPTQDS